MFVATGAAIPRELARRARDVLGAEVGGGFGTTESCMGAGFVPGLDDERAWTSDGVALANVTLRVVDDDGRELPPGTEGNFEIGTDTLFEGYLNRPEQTAAALTEDGCYRPGRPRDDRRRRIPADHRPRQGRDQPRRREGAGRRGRAAAVRAPGGARGRDRRDARRAPRRARLRVRGAGRRRRRPASTSRRCRHIWTRERVAKPYWPERLEMVESFRARRPARFRSSCCASRRCRLTDVDRKAIAQMTTVTDIDADAARRRRARRADGRDPRVRRQRRRALDRADRGRARRSAELVGRAARARLPAAGGAGRLGGRGLPFTRYLELLELFAMSHASLRMIVHV